MMVIASVWMRKRHVDAQYGWLAGALILDRKLDVNINFYFNLWLILWYIFRICCLTIVLLISWWVGWMNLNAYLHTHQLMMSIWILKYYISHIRNLPCWLWQWLVETFCWCMENQVSIYSLRIPCVDLMGLGGWQKNATLLVSLMIFFCFWFLFGLGQKLIYLCWLFVSFD